MELSRFAKHSSRISRIQCIHNSTILNKHQTSNHSIERFHGSLLFVDISGFTALSQALDLNDLKTHINAYFSVILDIVCKYAGDVVKFAGDALFIIWTVDSGKYRLFSF